MFLVSDSNAPAIRGVYLLFRWIYSIFNTASLTKERSGIMKLFKRSLAVFVALALLFGAYQYSQADWKKETKVVGEVFRLLETEYLYKVDLTQCRYDILKSLSRESLPAPDPDEKNSLPVKKTEFICLDEHSYALTPEEYRVQQEEMSGHFSGIGARVGPGENGGVTVVEPLDGSPALKSGMKAGDIIVKVRQENESEAKLVGDDIKKAVEMLRGEKGTKVFVTVERGVALIDLVITRDDVKTSTVTYKDLSNNIGYIALSVFNAESADDLEAALRTFRKFGPNPKVVIDVRENPGGFLGSVLEMLYYFSDKPDDIMLTTKFKRNEEVKTIKNTFGAFIDPATKQLKSPGEFKDYRIVILANQRSYSAAEIFAGTMKDWGFTVVGSVTYGKGVGQTVFPLSDGSALTLTTFEYLVGNLKTSVNKKGVSPIFEAEDSRKLASDTLGANDNQFQKALEFLNKI